MQAYRCAVPVPERRCSSTAAQTECNAVQRSRSAGAELTILPVDPSIGTTPPQRAPPLPGARGAGRGSRVARGMADAESNGSETSQPANSMRSSGRRGRFSARSASTTTCKPGVELSNTLDEDCTVIRRVARQRLPRRGARYARATHAGLRPACRAVRARREPSPQRRSACRRPGRLCCGWAQRRWLRAGTPSTAAPPRRVACEDRAGLLLDLTEHLKAQQVRRTRRGAAGRDAPSAPRAGRPGLCTAAAALRRTR